MDLVEDQTIENETIDDELQEAEICLYSLEFQVQTREFKGRIEALVVVENQ